MKDTKVKFDIENGQSFFADEVGVIHNPLKIILDFRSITPRVDVRNQEYQTLVLRHNVILMDPYTAKSFFDVLGKNIKNYEKEFGKIEKPSQLKKLEKKAAVKSSKKGNKDSPTYFG
ncbi:TPA: DUF3467 domain-containing protein [Candidatus Woesearchaeota archaeon]|nr:hypothetical protein QT06_C0001G0026 [archaeon GW2011_AR15]MBS3104163.1 DUF3467 domain-containing protein [Candidatus Woesearchaeota archaeon]HIH41443.1 DUF3467 domain-containing protein [Candidatus Woesearchaeota archaeon]